MDQAEALMTVERALCNPMKLFRLQTDPEKCCKSNAFVYETKTFNVSGITQSLFKSLLPSTARFVYIPPDLQEKPRLGVFAPLTASVKREIPMSHPLGFSVRWRELKTFSLIDLLC
jgi:hypothetical protein